MTGMPPRKTQALPVEKPKARKLPQHLSKSFEHFTPAHIVEAARVVLGRIDLDPASCAKAQKTVNATRYFSLPTDGLAQPWGGRVFLNPPGGTFTPRRTDTSQPKPKIKKSDAAAKEKWGTDSRAVGWWRKLVKGHTLGAIHAAIFVGFNLDILQASQEEGYANPLDFSFCIPAARLRFSGNSPSHGNVVIYLGPQRELFRSVFSKIGAVKL